MKYPSTIVCVVICLLLVVPRVALTWQRYDSDLVDYVMMETNSNYSHCSITISGPIQTNMVLTSVIFNITATFPPFFSDGLVIPDHIHYLVWSNDSEVNFVQSIYSHQNETGPTFSLHIPFAINSSGFHDVNFVFMYLDKDVRTLLCPKQVVNFLAIPGIVTLLPPILTAIIAILFRQVLIALLLGIWMCALFANRYNPLLATLRTLDTYFVNSVADPDHAAIAVFSFFLGGLIGVVQKSGGGLGLASLLQKLTGSRRRASLACIILGSMIFFDDYSLVLIAGTSLRAMMKNAGVSKEKFAYILKSLGPTLPSLVPVSSWIGVQVGYLQTTLKSQFCQECSNLKDTDAFVVALSTIPYRFFPLLLLFSIILIVLLNRDFGPLLTAERNVAALSLTVKSPESVGEHKKRSLKKNVLCVDQVDHDINMGNEQAVLEMRGSVLNTNMTSDIDAYIGPLAPKKGIKYRWYNAAIPFLVTMLFTLIGMVVGGYETIKKMPSVEVTIINIFTYANSVDSLIWASTLACVISMAMLLIPRILTLQEYMDSWVEGVKDLIEPFLVLWLAWALGQALQDVQTTNYLAKSLEDGGMKAEYVPAIVTIVGFIMSFAAGSAFGTMGIIFPLVIPTVCKISNCNYDIVLQTSAAVLASSIFGNVISPIAGICILTVFASECALAPHIKSAALYSVIIAVVSVLFGALPVGAGWYPWYVAWFIMAAIMVTIFTLFSSSADSPTSKPLLKRICPWVYSMPSSAMAHLKHWLFRKCEGRRCCTCCGKKNSVGEGDPLLA